MSQVKNYLTMAKLLATFAVVLAFAEPLLASDPDMLQDVCVADYKSLEGRKSSLAINRLVFSQCT